MDEWKWYWGTKRVEGTPRVKDGHPGYAVRYADGYESWSPQAVFEEAYQPLDRLSFGHALLVLKANGKVRRAGWNGNGQHLEIYHPAASDLMTVPYIFITTVEGNLVPWLASQTDMLANDWQVVA